MDMWEDGYRDGFREAIGHLQELQDEYPDASLVEAITHLERAEPLLVTAQPWTTGRRE